MKGYEIFSLFLLISLAFIGSDIFKAEILTEVKISPMHADPDKDNLINIRNAGYVQADNVIILLTANNTIADFSGKCMEGKISKFNETALTAKFLRITPGIPCNFTVEVFEPTSLDYLITVEGGLGSNNDLPILLSILGITAIVVLIFLVEVYIMYRMIEKLRRKSLYLLDRFWYASKRLIVGGTKKTFSKDKNAGEIISFTKEKYDVDIDYVDATILKYIHDGNTTRSQLMKKTNLSNLLIQSRIAKMRKQELLEKDKNEIHGTLKTHLDLLGNECNDESVADQDC